MHSFSPACVGVKRKRNQKEFPTRKHDTNMWISLKKYIRKQPPGDTSPADRHLPIKKRKRKWRATIRTIRGDISPFLTKYILSNTPPITQPSKKPIVGIDYDRETAYVRVLQHTLYKDHDVNSALMAMSYYDEVRMDAPFDHEKCVNICAWIACKFNREDGETHKIERPCKYMGRTPIYWSDCRMFSRMRGGKILSAKEMVASEITLLRHLKYRCYRDTAYSHTLRERLLPYVKKHYDLDYLDDPKTPQDILNLWYLVAFLCVIVPFVKTVDALNTDELSRFTDAIWMRALHISKHMGWRVRSDSTPSDVVSTAYVELLDCAVRLVIERRMYAGITQKIKKKYS